MDASEPQGEAVSGGDQNPLPIWLTPKDTKGGSGTRDYCASPLHQLVDAMVTHGGELRVPPGIYPPTAPLALGRLRVMSLADKGVAPSLAAYQMAADFKFLKDACGLTTEQAVVLIDRTAVASYLQLNATGLGAEYVHKQLGDAQKPE